MDQTESTGLPEAGGAPWTVVRRRLFDGVVIGLVGACLTVLNLYFAPRRPGIAITVGAGGYLLLWIGWNVAHDTDPLERAWGRDGVHDWIHLVVLSLLTIGVVVGTASAILGA